MTDEQVFSTSGVAVSQTAIEAFAKSLRGALIRPGHSEYDSMRTLYNAMIDKRPGAIVRCANQADVAAAVNFARDNGIRVAVKGGSHGVAGLAICDGGVVIDFSAMKGITVDAERRTARAEPGVKWGEFDRATQANGLATTGGTNTDTGIAGLTLGGGLGWLMGKHGLTCDNLLSAELVTGDGRLVNASANENQDLFWGLRGGGGNFGIVTSFEYQLHPVGPVLAGMVVHPAAAVRDVLRFYRDFTSDAPDELTCQAAFLTAPDGTRVCAVPVCYAGSIAEGERVLRGLRSFGHPIDDQIRARPYSEIQSIFDDAFPVGRLNYWKSNFLRELSDAAIDMIADRCATIPSPMSAVAFEDIHGAVGRVGLEQTAFAAREARHNFSIFSVWTDSADSERQIRWTREFYAAMEPFFGDLTYVNYLDRGDENRIRNAYGPNYDRLVALKNKYDPTNFFRMNQNIKPMA